MARMHVPIAFATLALLTAPALAASGTSLEGKRECFLDEIDWSNPVAGKPDLSKLACEPQSVENAARQLLENAAGISLARLDLDIEVNYRFDIDDDLVNHEEYHVYIGTDHGPEATVVLATVRSPDRDDPRAALAWGVDSYGDRNVQGAVAWAGPASVGSALAVIDVPPCPGLISNGVNPSWSAYTADPYGQSGAYIGGQTGLCVAY